MTYLLDLGTCEALRNYLYYGFHPGSFGYALLIQDVDLAHARAHVALGEECVRDMLTFTSMMPPISFGDYETVSRWISHEGLASADGGMLSLAKLSWNPELFGPFPEGVYARCGSFRKFGHS